MHPGLRKLLYNLSEATKIVDERTKNREKLHMHLRKIRRKVSPKKRIDIKEEIKKLEKHIGVMLDKKIPLTKGTKKAIEKKEAELDDKIVRLNKLLFRFGKKISPKKLKKELGKKKQPRMIDTLEEKLYVLEGKYHKLKENPKHSKEILKRVRDKISLLKRKIREIK